MSGFVRVMKSSLSKKAQSSDFYLFYIHIQCEDIMKLVKSCWLLLNSRSLECIGYPQNLIVGTVCWYKSG